MSPRRQVIILSPHPDDAAFSTGGLLASLQDTIVMVITCFSRSCCRDRDDSPATTSVRSLEDEAYARHIGARLIRLGLPDSGLRTNAGREQLATASEELLRHELDSLLRPLLRLAAGPNIFVPLAIGSHPDHVHCRDLAFDAYADLNLVFYEDLPYGQMAGGPATVNRIVRDRYPHLRDCPLALTGQQMEKKMMGLDFYTSQLHPKWRKDIARYARKSRLRPGGYGERYWIPA